MEVSIKDLYDFKTCSVRYRLTEIGQVTTKAPKDEIRDVFTSLLRYYYLQKEDGYEVTYKEMKEKLSQLLYNTKGFSVLEPKSKPRREQELKVFKLLNTFFEHEEKVEQKIISVFTEFRMPFSPEFVIKDEIPLIRVVDNEIELVVFKTGRNYINTFWLETDIAISLYAMAYQSLFKKPIDRICIYHIPSASIYYTHRKTKHYKRFMRSVRVMEKVVKEGAYYPRESYMCDTCPARIACLEHY